MIVNLPAIMAMIIHAIMHILYQQTITHTICHVRYLPTRVILRCVIHLVQIR